MPGKRPPSSLTEKAVSAALPRESKYIVYDAELLGFGLRVYPSGRKSYVMRLTFREAYGVLRERLHTVGDVGDFESVKAARAAATTVRGEYKKGRDLLAEKRKEQRQAIRLCDLRDTWLEDRLARGKHRPLTQADIRAAFDTGFSDWLDKPIGRITGDMLSARHRERSQKSPARADLESRYLRALWRWAAATYPDLELGLSPTAHLAVKGEWNSIPRKRRRLDGSSAQAWFAALDTLSVRDRSLCLLATYTGARIGELMGLRWDDVDLVAGTVTFRQTKTDPVILPVSRQARTAINELSRETEWLFPAVRRNGEIGPMVQVASAVASLKKASGVAWSPHDARRGYISMSYKIGLPETISRRLTNHALRQDDAHDGYTTMTAHELAPFAQRICDHLEAMLNGRDEVARPTLQGVRSAAPGRRKLESASARAT